MLKGLDQPTLFNARLYLAVTMFFWAGNHVVGKWADGHIPPMTLAFLRWSGAALIMLPLAWTALVTEKVAVWANRWRLVLLGLLGSGAYNTLQYIALTETSVTNAAILNSAAPVLIAAAGALLFADRLRASEMAGLAISLAGVLCIILRGNPGTLSSLDFNHGDLVMLLATIVWAVYTTLLRTRPEVSTLSFAAVTYAVAGLANLPLAVFEVATGQVMEVSPVSLAAVAYTAIFPSCLAYYLYTRGVEILGPTRAGAFIHLVPLFASLMAMALLGEAPHAYHAIGFALIFSGVSLASR